MTRIDPQRGSATCAIITRQSDGDTDLAFAKPGTRSTTILYDMRVLGHIFGQGFLKLDQSGLCSSAPLDTSGFEVGGALKRGIQDSSVYAYRRARIIEGSKT
jgi:hypothetical protein